VLAVKKKAHTEIFAPTDPVIMSTLSGSAPEESQARLLGKGSREDFAIFSVTTLKLCLKV